MEVVIKMGKKSLVLILAIVVLAGGAGYFWTKNRLLREELGVKGKSVAKESVAGSQATATPTQKNYKSVLGGFLVTDKEVCLAGGKPLVYFFGSSSCPHCTWEKPVMAKVAKSFGEEIDYHENFDSSTDSEVFEKYADINPGYVPFLVLGCKYARVGSGERLGKDNAESTLLEEEAIKTILCKLTTGKPQSVCNGLKDKISQIE